MLETSSYIDRAQTQLSNHSQTVQTNQRQNCVWRKPKHNCKLKQFITKLLHPHYTTVPLGLAPFKEPLEDLNPFPFCAFDVGECGPCIPLVKFAFPLLFDTAVLSHAASINPVVTIRCSLSVHRRDRNKISNNKKDYTFKWST